MTDKRKDSLAILLIIGLTASLLKSAALQSLSTIKSALFDHHSKIYYSSARIHRARFCTSLFGKVAGGENQLPLTVEQIAARWRLLKFNGYSNDAYYGLDLLDKSLFAKTEKITLSRVGGIGLELLEMQVSDDNRAGLVMIGGCSPESNAEKCGLFLPGDVLMGISSVDDESQPSKRYLSLEACTFDETVARMGQFADLSSVTLTVQRLLPRKSVVTVIVGPEGEEVGNFTVLAGYGMNLRTTLQSNNIRLYDERTYRFDSPYQQGNCGGDGTCGTCLVAILEGKNLLNDKVRVEGMALKKQAAPPNYRWACRVQIAPDATQGGVVKVKLRPQTAVWDANVPKR